MSKSRSQPNSYRSSSQYGLPKRKGLLSKGLLLIPVLAIVVLAGLLLSGGESEGSSQSALSGQLVLGGADGEGSERRIHTFDDEPLAVHQSDDDKGSQADQDNGGIRLFSEGDVVLHDVSDLQGYGPTSYLDDEQLAELEELAGEDFEELEGEEATELVQELTQPEDQAEPEWRQYVVEQGDSLTAIFNKLGLPSQTMYQVLNVEGKEKPLTRLRPGQPIDYQLDTNGSLLSLQVEVSRTQSWLYTVNQYGDFTREDLKREGEMVRGTVTGVVDGSFWSSAGKAGMEPGQIDYFSSIFQWKVDFSRDLRKGDSFSMIYEEEHLDGEVTGRGRILAAMLINRGKEYTVFRHTDGQYYDLDGNSMSNAFMRYPIDGTYRISSHFNPNRRHPVTRRIAPHNGTDFAARTGTPVLAAGAGTVITAAYNRFNGNYLVIKHNDRYVTKYLHLSRKLVKKGQRVRMGQRIALSGNTGRSTGPHLHYEFHVNNRPVNALRVNLPMADKLSSSELKKFRSTNQPLMAQLEQSKQLLLAAR